MDLSKVKLRHVAAPVAAPKASSADQAGELQVLMARVRECDLDVWYERLHKWTFPTEFIPLSRGEASAICNAYKRHESAAALPDLARTLQAVDAAIARFGGVAFVKLSSRSPKVNLFCFSCAALMMNWSSKDATVAGERTKRHFERALAESAEKDDNAVFAALNRAHINALAVNGAAEALDLFLKSERIFDDLELALEDQTNWSQRIVVRKWIDMPLSCEYRGFVHDGQLTALSQYFAPCCFAELQSDEAQRSAVEKCKELVKEIRHLLPSAVVADFAVTSQGVLLLEINPFNNYAGCGTSACLFNWSADRDVLEGRAPFEFRFVREKEANLKALVGQEWKQYFK